MSSDGRFVVYDAGAPGGLTQVYVYDTESHLTTAISVSVNGELGDGYSAGPSISPDGRFVSFVSYADNLGAGDSNGDIGDVFTVDLATIVWDRPSATTVNPLS